MSPTTMDFVSMDCATIESTTMEPHNGLHNKRPRNNGLFNRRPSKNEPP